MVLVFAIVHLYVIIFNSFFCGLFLKMFNKLDGMVNNTSMSLHMCSFNKGNID